MPKTFEPLPPVLGPWVRAWARAATIGARFSDAIATEALSMIRLITMSVTSSVTSTGSAATLAIL